MKKFNLFLFSILSVAILISCSKDNEEETIINEKAPKIETVGSSNITKNSVLLNGKVIDSSGSKITERGFCWSSTNSTPTISDNKTVNSGTLANYSNTISSLNSNTKYYYRAYAKNSFGIGYGSVLNFTTQANSTFFAKINGVPFNPDYVTTTYNVSTGEYTIYGYTGIKGIEVNITENATIGNHPITFGGDYSAFIQKGVTYEFYCTGGNLNLTTFNKTTKNLAGTFAFDGTNLDADSVVVITEGNFNVFW